MANKITMRAFNLQKKIKRIFIKVSGVQKLVLRVFRKENGQMVRYYIPTLEAQANTDATNSKLSDFFSRTDIPAIYQFTIPSGVTLDSNDSTIPVLDCSEAPSGSQFVFIVEGSAVAKGGRGGTSEPNVGQGIHGDDGGDVFDIAQKAVGDIIIKGGGNIYPGHGGGGAGGDEDRDMGTTGEPDPRTWPGGSGGGGAPFGAGGDAATLSSHDGTTAPGEDATLVDGGAGSDGSTDGPSGGSDTGDGGRGGDKNAGALGGGDGYDHINNQVNSGGSPGAKGEVAANRGSGVGLDTSEFNGTIHE